jgi:hypothetical protein
MEPGHDLINNPTDTRRENPNARLAERWLIQYNNNDSVDRENGMSEMILET